MASLQQRRALIPAAVAVCVALASCTIPTPSASFTPSLDSLIAAGVIDTSSHRAWADTAAGDPASDVYRRWIAWLAEGRDNPGRACQRSEYWLPEEQAQWRCFALAFLYVPLGASAQVMRIAPDANDRNAYRILTLFRSDSTRSALRSAVTLMTTFAVRSESTWVFANALPRFTASWRRETVGPITYVMAPGYDFRRDRAANAARYADSLATLFGAPRLQSLTYFLLPTVDDVYRIMGLQTPLTWGPQGGVTQPMNGMLFSGDPALGEEYRHELAHTVLSPIARSPLTFVAEGVPTWLGGTSGLSLQTAAESLATFLRTHTKVTLDSMIERRYPTLTKYASGAVFTAMVFDRGGINAVKNLYGSNARAPELRNNMEQLFQTAWPDIAAAWHTRVLSFAPSTTRPVGPPN